MRDILVLNLAKSSALGGFLEIYIYIERELNSLSSLALLLTNRFFLRERERDVLRFALPKGEDFLND